MKKSFYALLFLLLPFISISQTISYDFEDGNIEGWSQYPADMWEVSDKNPLNGLLSLKHKVASLPSGVTYVDRISAQLPNWDANEGSITWRFLLRHNQNPSLSNHWAVFLASNQDAEGMIASASPNGYAIGVNLTGLDDILRFFRVNDGVFTPIIETDINWEEQVGATLSSVAAVEVERKIDGTFTLKVSTSGSFLTMEVKGTAVDVEHPFAGFLGVYYSYTSSYTGRLTVDDISLRYKPFNPNDHDVIVEQPEEQIEDCLLYTSPSPRDRTRSRMPSSA